MYSLVRKFAKEAKKAKQTEASDNVNKHINNIQCFYGILGFGTYMG